MVKDEIFTHRFRQDATSPGGQAVSIRDYAYRVLAPVNMLGNESGGGPYALT